MYRFGMLYPEKIYQPWCRCYDFLIFSPKKGRKNGILTQNKDKLHMQKCDHNIGF
jgi:hypothetical protein